MEKTQRSSESQANRVNNAISVSSYSIVDLKQLFHKTRKRINYYIPYNLGKLGEEKNKIKSRFGYSNKWQNNVYLGVFFREHTAYKGLVNFNSRHGVVLVCITVEGMQTMPTNKLNTLLPTRINVNEQRYFVRDARTRFTVK